MKKGKKEDKVQLYVYLDDEGLDSMYAQCGEFLVENLTTLENAGKIEGSAKVKTGQILNILGIGGAELDGQLSINRLKSESVKSIFLVEHRVPLLLDYLKTTKQIHELNENNIIIKEGGYILFESKFLTPNLSEVLDQAKPKRISPSSQDNITRGFVKFTAQLNSIKITMGTSVAKYKIGLHHLIYMWQSVEGDRRIVNLSVFGYISKVGSNDYYLKPYAIVQLN